MLKGLTSTVPNGLTSTMLNGLTSIMLKGVIKTSIRSDGTLHRNTKLGHYRRQQKTRISSRFAGKMSFIYLCKTFVKSVIHKLMCSSVLFIQ